DRCCDRDVVGSVAGVDREPVERGVCMRDPHRGCEAGDVDGSAVRGGGDRVDAGRAVDLDRVGGAVGEVAAGAVRQVHADIGQAGASQIGDGDAIGPVEGVDVERLDVVEI